MSEKTNQPQKSRKAWLIENIISLSFTLLIVFMIRSSIVEAYKIPSGSMIPTLYIGDHIFVNKFAYGFKIPFSDLVTDHPIYFIDREPPKRGDIIVFIYPVDESLYYIKRVIGVPGDTVEMRDKVLYVNGTIFKQELWSNARTSDALKDLNDPHYPETKMNLYTEEMGTVKHTIMVDSRKTGREDFGPITVPANSLFVMGDNRDWSGDSRYWGFVPMKNVKGKAFITWMSLWIDFTEKEFNFRPSRIGTLLQ